MIDDVNLDKDNRPKVNHVYYSHVARFLESLSWPGGVHIPIDIEPNIPHSSQKPDDTTDC